ncbi:MAG: hypothetical protein RR574_14895, partial [Comamonas sp.]
MLAMMRGGPAGGIAYSCGFVALQAGMDRPGCSAGTQWVMRPPALQPVSHPPQQHLCQVLAQSH